MRFARTDNTTILTLPLLYIVFFWIVSLPSVAISQTTPTTPPGKITATSQESLSKTQSATIASETPSSSNPEKSSPAPQDERDWRLIATVAGIAISVIWNFANTGFTWYVSCRNRKNDKAATDFKDSISQPMNAILAEITDASDDLRTNARMQSIPNSDDLKEINRKIAQSLQKASSLINRAAKNPNFSIDSAFEIHGEYQDIILEHMNNIMSSPDLVSYNTHTASLETEINEFTAKIQKVLTTKSFNSPNSKQ